MSKPLLSVEEAQRVFDENRVPHCVSVEPFTVMGIVVDQAGFRAAAAAVSIAAKRANDRGYDQGRRDVADYRP